MTYPSTPDDLPSCQAMCEALKAELGDMRRELEFAVIREHDLKVQHEATVEARISFYCQFSEALGIPRGEQVDTAHALALARIAALKAAEADLRARDARTCDKCQHSYQHGSDLPRCLNASGCYCATLGNACGAFVPKVPA